MFAAADAAHTQHRQGLNFFTVGYKVNYFIMTDFVVYFFNLTVKLFYLVAFSVILIKKLLNYEELHLL